MKKYKLLLLEKGEQRIERKLCKINWYQFPDRTNVKDIWLDRFGAYICWESLITKGFCALFSFFFFLFSVPLGGDPTYSLYWSFSINVFLWALLVDGYVLPSDSVNSLSKGGELCQSKHSVKDWQDILNLFPALKLIPALSPHIFLKLSKGVFQVKTGYCLSAHNEKWQANSVFFTQRQWKKKMKMVWKDIRAKKEKRSYCANY